MNFLVKSPFNFSVLYRSLLLYLSDNDKEKKIKLLIKVHIILFFGEMNYGLSILI